MDAKVILNQYKCHSEGNYEYRESMFRLQLNSQQNNSVLAEC